ncbi:MAG: membrane-associated phospholipid phosphatase [Saprospiraceae bacterium]|jgi:membrane-associated phospholipid phosphatase
MRNFLNVATAALVLLFCNTGYSQDTLGFKRANVSTYLLPSTLIISGLILNKDKVKNDVRNWVRDRHSIPNTGIDDMLQHSPMVMMYLGDLVGKRPVDEVMRQTRHLLVSQAMTLGAMLILKESTDVLRPNGGSVSFPSGHTAYSFAGATVFYHAFKKESKWLAYMAYVPATITGVYRILKDKHWVSDVVFGAGLGLLSSQLSYHLNIWNSATVKGKKKDKLNFSIGMASNSYGIGAYLSF